MLDETSQNAKPSTGLSLGGKLPGREPEPVPAVSLGGNNMNVAKPKPAGLGLGLGRLDLSKAQQLQQQHLTMAEEKKSHARETAV